jgi:regulator of sigma E protease
MSWALAFIGFALLIILHEAGHFAAAKAVGMRVERFSLFFPPLLARKKVGETEYALGLIPLGGYVKISGMNPSEELPDDVRTRAYWSQAVWKRVVVIAAGPAVNLVLAFVGLMIFFSAIGPVTPTNIVGTVQAGYPAAGVVEPGDRLVAVDGRRGTPSELRRVVASHRCAGPPVAGCEAVTPARLTLRRGGETIQRTIRPVYDSDAKLTRLGFGYADGPRRTEPIGQAVVSATRSFANLTVETVKLPLRVFDAEKREEITGVVGSYEITRQTILNDVANTVAILSVISLSLAIVNLFPFLPLDGGHIFWAVVEKVRGRPVSYAVMERSSVVGFMLVMGLFLIGLTNDLGRLTGEGFQVR